MDDRGRICVFFKSPVAGSVKTRLIPAVGAERAARLAEAFFLDTWDAVCRLHWADAIVATTGPIPNHVKTVDPVRVWAQGDGDLGERLERVLRRALSDAPFAMALGADSPGLPTRLLAQARAALDSCDAVLGPCEDGGFYLLGLRRCPPRLLADIPWSQPHTFAHTLSRLQEAGLKVRTLEPWFDVDQPEDLAKLRHMISDGGVSVPETARALQEADQFEAGARSKARQRLTLSIIIPTLNEREQLPETLARIEALGLASEIIVVDGGSTDGTREWLARQSSIQVVESARGKGVQLNAGARVSSGDVLLFLHADCRLPQDAGSRIEAALRFPDVVGGGFQVRFAEQRPWLLRPVAAGINLRSRLRQSATGDQAIFVRRSAFEGLGGFAEWPLFEDVDLVNRLKKLGRFVVLGSKVVISSRRYLTKGILRTVLTIHALRVGYSLGISPFVLKNCFEDLRPHLISGPQPNFLQDRASLEAVEDGLGYWKSAWVKRADPAVRS